MEASAILAAVKIAQQQAKASGEIYTPTPNPLQECGLDNVDCQICHNTGYIAKIYPDGSLRAEKCACMAKRVSIRNLERSGMKDMIRRYTFASYETDTERTKLVKSVAERFCAADAGWFFISGKPGSGKTHICTAVCSRLMDKGKAVRYMMWRDASAELKGLLTDGEEYQERIRPFKRIPVLYIDDFLKLGSSDADLRLAFEILNSRYNDTSLRTVISSEKALTDILSLDEALGGRIYERAKGYVLESPTEDRRMHG